MAVTGKPRSYYKRFKFLVEIDGVTYAGFRTCSELSGELAKVEQWEGGALTADTSPGRLTFTDITLERGATQDTELKEWWEQTVKASSNSGLVEPNYKRNADIVQQDRDNSTLRRWRLTDAWPTKFIYGDWDNEADENVVESITLTFKYCDEV